MSEFRCPCCKAVVEQIHDVWQKEGVYTKIVTPGDTETLRADVGRLRRSLEAAHFTDEGGEYWKPPVNHRYRELWQERERLLSDLDEMRICSEGDGRRIKELSAIFARAGDVEGMERVLDEYRGNRGADYRMSIAEVVEVISAWLKAAP